MIFYKIIFFISAFIILWAMIGYSLSLKIINKMVEKKENKKNYNLEPTVTVMVVAHNEEKVIFEKLNNLKQIVYPIDRIKFLISSDNSTDKTNQIVRTFIENNSDLDITLYEVKERKGKTNAQNEAQKLVTTEFLVMTDANSILEKNSVKELMASFVSDDINYVTGRLTIVNEDLNNISKSENTYWDKDLHIRDIESKIQTITAGNGALYACRNSEYVDFDPIKCHDSSMPLYYALNQKRAIANHDAIAYEKAGENIEDEFGRKVRMNRVLLQSIIPDIRVLNVFKYKWYSYFYFGHRTCRYLLWLAHFFVLISSALLIKTSSIYFLVFVSQIIFYSLAFFKHFFKIENKYINLIYYYTVTIAAQWVGVFNILTGKAKPFWDKAESTR
ncbi:glycosyltransferase [Vagococcus carniphilus]|uniref:glycosyltransferase n=1 Tax=Vagococcus carniphilus TaxID=218144 RepID=UPI00288E6B2E|nr:glycosyltransferase [Vagococcus carniphilus]MDT2865748.1 glycosyltransferase [Vagococcus carniphilus]